jgi:hypothetical protein
MVACPSCDSVVSPFINCAHAIPNDICTCVENRYGFNCSQGEFQLEIILIKKNVTVAQEFATNSDFVSAPTMFMVSTVIRVKTGSIYVLTQSLSWWPIQSLQWKRILLF